MKFQYNVINQQLAWFYFFLRKCNRMPVCILKQGISYIWHAACEYFICPINKGLLVSFLEYYYFIVSIYHINWACRCIKWQCQCYDHKCIYYSFAKLYIIIVFKPNVRKYIFFKIWFIENPNRIHILGIS